MAKVEINFVGQAYNLPATQLDAQRSINWYLSVDPNGKFKTALVKRFGLLLYYDDSSSNENRGAFVLNNNLYVVIDDKFYIYNTNLTRKLKGTLNTSTGRVQMISNGFQIFITDTSYGYVYQIIASSSHEAEEFFVIENASSQIGEPTFEGIGLDDMTTEGTYLGDEAKTYRVVIDSISGFADTFKWSNDGGETFEATGVTITGLPQTLEDGIQIDFMHTTGHTVNDSWDSDVTIDSAFYVPVIPAYIDGYGVYIKQASYRFYISRIDDFSYVNALDYASANSLPDDLVAAISIHQELWMFGKNDAELWYDTGNPDFPLQRRSNFILNYGCLAPYTIKVAHNNNIYLFAKNDSGGRIVIEISNYNAIIISTEPINKEFRNYEKIDDAFADMFERDGHIFYVITFPSEDITWVYDITTKSWFEWKSTIPNDWPYSFPTRQGRWLTNWHVYFDDKNLVGDFRSGNIYELNDTYYYDNGYSLRCERITQHIDQELQWLTFNSLHVDGEMGRGLVTGQGSDPQLMLQVSKDGGKSWGNELWRSGGEIGEYKIRAIWYRLGMGRSFTFKLVTSDPTFNTIFGSIGDVEVSD